jgi:hypothetical protein
MNAFELLSIAVEFRRISRLWLTLVAAERFEDSEIKLSVRTESAFRRCTSRGCLVNLEPSLSLTTKAGSGFYEIVGYDRVFYKDDPSNEVEHCFEWSSLRPGTIGSISGGVFDSFWDVNFPLGFDLNSPDLIEAVFERYSIICESVAVTIEAFERDRNTASANQLKVFDPEDPSEPIRTIARQDLARKLGLVPSAINDHMKKGLMPINPGKKPLLFNFRVAKEFYSKVMGIDLK